MHGQRQANISYRIGAGYTAAHMDSLSVFPKADYMIDT